MTEPSKEVMKRDPIYELLTTYKTAIKNVLPKHLTPERILRVAYMAIHRTPKLRECTHESIINAVLEISMLGLDIGRTAHIVPFGKEATFICDYKGFIDLAHRSERIEAFTFKPVYEHDDFQYEEGTNRYIKHKPFRGLDRGDLTAAYSIVFFKHGGYDFEVVEAPDIAATKKSSPGAKRSDSPWNKPDQVWTMWCKTAVRRLAKRVPQSPELQRAAYLEELAEAGLKQDIHHVSRTIDIEPMPTDDLTAAIKKKEVSDFTPLEENARQSFPKMPEKPDTSKTEAKAEPASVEPETTEPDPDKVEQKTVPETWGEWRKEWVNKKGPGFSTYFHKNREHFERIPDEMPELKAEAKAKWVKFYPETRWPLDPQLDKETEQMGPGPEIITSELIKQIAAFDGDIIKKVVAGYPSRPIDDLTFEQAESALKSCQELKDEVAGLSPEGEELNEVNKEINLFPMQTIETAQGNLELPTNRVLSLDESTLLLAECVRITTG